MPRGRPDKLDSSKEVAGYHGMEVVQPGLIPAFYPSQQSDLGYLDTVKSCEATPQQQRICGLRKVTFWLVLVLGALTVVVVGASVALGVVLSRSRDNDTQPESASTGGLSPTSTYSDSAQTPSPFCPGAHNTLATDGIGSTEYRVLCDSDFGDSGKEILSSFELSSFDSCLSLCNTMNYFQERADVGCSYNKAGITPGTCWCIGGNDKEIVPSVGNVIAQPM